MSRRMSCSRAVSSSSSFGGRGGDAGELPDHALGYRGREQRVSRGDRAHGADQLFGRVVFEHEPNLGAATRRFSSASAGPGLPAAALADTRATPGVRSAIALTSTTLGPSLGVPDDILPAQILTGGQGGGLDVGVIAGSPGATARQVRSMARWEAILIIAIGLGTGLAIAATALLPLSHAFTGGLRPYAPAGWLAAILGVSALLALVALSVPGQHTCRRRRANPVLLQRRWLP
jgi:hypothetical protein